MAFLTPAVLDALSTDADTFRRVYEFFAQGRAGVRDAASLAVSAPGGMNARVAAGEALVLGSENVLTQGAYHVSNDANVDLSVAAADATNPRNDLVIVKVQDAAYSGASKLAVAAVVTGTPAGSPADPSLVSHPNSLTVARIVVPALASAVTSGMITDLRPQLFGTLLPGGAGWSLRDSANANTNLGVTEAGLVTLRNALSLPPSAGGTVAPTSFGSVPVKIDEQAPSGSTPTVTFNSIPQGFRHLEIVLEARSATAAVNDDIFIRFNNDSGSNYAYNQLYSNNGAAGAGGANAVNNPLIARIPAASSSSISQAGMATIQIPFYSRSVYWKQARGQSSSWEAAAVSGFWSLVRDMQWSNTAAITRIDLIAGGNLGANGMFDLYGIP